MSSSATTTPAAQRSTTSTPNFTGVCLPTSLAARLHAEDAVGSRTVGAFGVRAAGLRALKILRIRVQGLRFLWVSGFGVLWFWVLFFRAFGVSGWLDCWQCACRRLPQHPTLRRVVYCSMLWYISVYYRIL